MDAREIFEKVPELYTAEDATLYFTLVDKAKAWGEAAQEVERSRGKVKEVEAVGDVCVADVAFDKECQHSEVPLGDFAPEVKSEFNTLRAIASIARRIHDLRLLPPHSRTLNYSILKHLIETTALYSNRDVKGYYKQYKQGDVVSDDLTHIADGELRRIKKEVQEYVDRMVQPSDFLETEVESGPFTGAYLQVLNYVVSRSGDGQQATGSNALKYLKDAGMYKTRFSWSPEVVDRLADVIMRHADYRGNIVAGTEPGSLFERSNLYTSLQHAHGAESQQPPGLHESVKKLLEDVGKEGRTDEPLTTLDIAILGGLHPRTYAVEQSVKLQRKEKKESWGDPFTKKWEPAAAADAPQAQDPIPLPAYAVYDVDSFFEKCMDYFDQRSDSAEDLGYVLMRTPLGQRSKHTSYLGFQKTGAVKPLANQPYERQNVRFGGLPGVPRDLFLQPPTARQSEKEVEKKDRAELRKAVRQGNLKLAKAHNKTKIQEMQVKRDQMEAATQEIKARTEKLTSDAEAAKRARARAEQEADEERRKRHQGEEYAERYEFTVRPPDATDYSLEAYCERCFQAGVAMYLRLAREMVLPHLEEVRKRELPPDFLRPFAKLIGLVVQRAEVGNSRVQYASESSQRAAMRTNVREMANAKVALADACGFEPDVQLEGYSLDGSYTGD